MPWPEVELRELLRLDLNRVPIEPSETYKMVGVYSFGRGLFHREPVFGGNTSYKYFYRLKHNHVVMSQLFGWEGALALSSNQFSGHFVSPQFPTFLCNEEKLKREYLGWLMRRPAFWQDLGTRTKGMGDRRRTLNPEALFRCVIPLPPLAEQRRIVARIEVLADKIAEARGLRQQTVEEAEALIRSQTGKIYTYLTERYESYKLSDLMIFAGYGTSTKCSYERVVNSLPVIRIPNVVSEKIIFKDLKFGNLKKNETERVLVAPGDLLIVRTNGSADLVGRCAVVPFLKEPMAFASYLIKITVDNNLVESLFLQKLLKHLRNQGQLIDFARTTAGQYNVSLGRLKTLELPIPPLPEQRRIVTYLDELQAKIDTLKRLQAETQRELKVLLPSVLEKAFRGEL